MEFLTNFVTSTTSILPEGFIFRSNFTNLLVGTHEDDILAYSSIPEIPGFWFYLFSRSPGVVFTFCGLAGLKLVTNTSRFFPYYFFI